MAQFSVQAYQAQQAARRSNNGPKNNNQTHFVNEFIKNDGDTVVVRFPYHSLDDLCYETTHSVRFPNDKFPKRVRCDGNDNCPLCKQKIKVDTRFFVKAIVYVVDDTTGEVKLVPAIWDRPAAFADIDIKNLMQEYGDLSESLFKIKRNGSGLDTRYTISYIANKTVYNPEVYKADFSILESVDPVRVLTKTMDQYIAAMSGDAGEEAAQPVQAQPVQTKSLIEEVDEKLNAAPQEPVVRQQIPVQPVETRSAAPRKYTF